jgi:hypothetical protein
MPNYGSDNELRRAIVLACIFMAIFVTLGHYYETWQLLWDCFSGSAAAYFAYLVICSQTRPLIPPPELARAHISGETPPKPTRKGFWVTKSQALSANEASSATDVPFISILVIRPQEGFGVCDLIRSIISNGYPFPRFEVIVLEQMIPENRYF